MKNEKKPTLMHIMIIGAFIFEFLQVVLLASLVTLLMPATQSRKVYFSRDALW